jgi:hypothetical protein
MGANPSVVDGVNVFNTMIVPVADYCIANNIDAVFCSAHVWPLFLCAGSGAGIGDYISTDAAFGAAKYFKAQGNLNLPGSAITTSELYGTPYAVVDNFGGVLEHPGESRTGGEPLAPNGLSYEVAKTLIPRFKERLSILPWGRIGLPKFTSATVAESLAETQRMVGDALWREGQSSARNIVIGVGGNVGRISAPWQWMAHEMAKAAGHSTNHILAGYTSGTNQSWFGEAATWTQANVLAGTANVPGDAYLGGAIGNPADTVTTLNNSLFPNRGAWGYETWSFGYRVGAALVMRGACAAIGSVSEPFASGIPDVASVMSAALKGWSLAEINWLLSPPAWMMTAFGDPLFRPFPAAGLVDGTVYTVKAVTPPRKVTNRSRTRTIRRIEP